MSFFKLIDIQIMSITNHKIKARKALRRMEICQTGIQWSSHSLVEVNIATNNNKKTHRKIGDWINLKCLMKHAKPQRWLSKQQTRTTTNGKKNQRQKSWISSWFPSTNPIYCQRWKIIVNKRIVEGSENGKKGKYARRRKIYELIFFRVFVLCVSVYGLIFAVCLCVCEFD